MRLNSNFYEGLGLGSYLETQAFLLERAHCTSSLPRVCPNEGLSSAKALAFFIWNSAMSLPFCTLGAMRHARRRKRLKENYARSSIIRITI